MVSPFEEKRASIVEPNRILRLLYALPLLTALALVAGIAWRITGHLPADPRDFGSFLGSMFMLTMLMSGATAVLVRTNVAARRSEGSVTVDLEGVRRGGELVARREAIKQAYLVPQPDGRCRVRLVGKRYLPVADLTVPSRERGTELLRALELDVLHRVLESPAILVTDGLRVRTRFIVGADGVVIRERGIGFIPYSDIEDVTIDSEGGLLRRRSGPAIRYIGFGVTPGALTERIREGLEAHRRREVPADAALLVARSGRPIPEWIAALRAISAPVSDYRQPEVPSEALWALTEDPAALPSARAGAAVVLRQRVGDEGRARLEATAAATAEPRVRIALEAAASGEEEALAEALRDCDDPGERQRA